MKRTWVDVGVVGSGEAEQVRTDPLAAALSVDDHELSVLTVDGRRRSQFLWTERRTRVHAVLTGAQSTAVRFELLAVVVSLPVKLTRLARLR